MKRFGGKTVYGASLGILMLETRFPRIPGDIGNASTWPFPVLYQVVPGASPDLVVRRNAEGLIDAFIEAGKNLIDQGADGIATNCGFLSIFQDDLSVQLSVPVASSSLMQVGQIRRVLPPSKRPGILTVSSSTLSEDHLRAAGVPPDTPVEGTERGSEFSRVFLDNEEEIDIDLARADVLGAGRKLCKDNRDIGAIVLECTNMVPFAADLRKALGLPVFSIFTFLQWFQAGLLPRRFSYDLDDSRI
ncbi:MAG: aspartate/glutamate racemase family protein [Kiloniellales bacterium]|nr:aspartate/glutamate racemase family protein [Kiloniellales bacterium]